MFIFFIQSIIYIFKKLFKMLTCIREFVLNFLFIFFICSIFFLFYHNYILNINDSHISKALRINLSGNLVDSTLNNNYVNWFVRLFFKNHDMFSRESSLFDIVNCIRFAKNDNLIKGVVLDLKDFIGSDLPSLHYLGKALIDFKSSGKFIYAIGDNYTQSQYFLASFANKIYLSPEGVVDLHGFSKYNFYYKSFLDKLQINTHVFRAGIYKSAVEPFLRNSMSSSSRKIDMNLISSLWKDYLSTISKNRNVNINKVFPKIDDMFYRLRTFDGNYAEYAKYLRLIDVIKPKELVEIELEKIFGKDIKKQNYNFININDYISKNKVINSSFNVAVIVVNGIISDERQSSEISNSDVIVNQIRYARLSNNIKAIILRINSPGGSVSASEKIYNELLAFKNTGKPLVVSMSGLAASGGYWITTTSNYIIGDKNTLTGSIGVFSVLNTLDKSLHAIGIDSDGVSTSLLSDTTSFRSLPYQVKNIMQLNVLHKYNNFIKLVAKSRNKTVDQINKVAKGRIWLGSEAKSLGLIDNLGDFDDAVNKVAKLIHIRKINLYWFNHEEKVLSSVVNYLNILFKFIFFNRINYFFDTYFFDDYIRNNYFHLRNNFTGYAICPFNVFLV